MSNCLIVTASAAKFADELARTGGACIPIRSCSSVESARSAYTDETVLFGDPNLIAELLPGMPRVDWVQSSWAGVTPLLSAKRRDYVLTGIRDVFGPQMSEYVIGYLLAHELRIMERVHEQRKRNWTSMPSGALAGKRLGIMGTGSIGQHVASTAVNFDMTVVGLSRSGAPAPGFNNVLQARRLHEFLADIDHLVSTLPQTAETSHLLDAEAIAVLPEHAYFINVGRSNVVEDQALIDALQSGSLAGAALDVFDEEPLASDSALWDVPNLSITAHIAAVSHPALIVPIFVENYRRYVAGEPLSHVIDFDAGY